MATWPKDELDKIAEADDLHIAPFREDGVTYGTPTWIWSVAVDGALYVRGYNGRAPLDQVRLAKGGRIVPPNRERSWLRTVDGPVNDARRRRLRGRNTARAHISAR